jgi:hypothetical protein
VSIAELIATVVGIASVVLIALQVHLAARTLREDHLRRKQQATLDYLVRDVRPHWRDDLRTVARDLRGSPGSTTVAEQFAADQPGNAPVAKLLSSVEHMAVGINVGVYDIEVLDRASGRFLIRIFRQFLPYIRTAQAKLPTAYVEFEQMVTELCRRRGEPVPTLDSSKPMAQHELQASGDA